MGAGETLAVEMHQIRYFLAVCEALNFTRAAESCNVSQPSLTRAIKGLEDELGGPLFRRERNNTHLTGLGEMMLVSLIDAAAVMVGRTPTSMTAWAEPVAVPVPLEKTAGPTVEQVFDCAGGTPAHDWPLVPAKETPVL